MPGAFYAIIDEDEGIFLVYKDTMTVERLHTDDIAFAAGKLGITGGTRLDTLYAVANNLSGGRTFSQELQKFRDARYPFQACLPLDTGVKVTLGRGDRAVNRGDR